MQFKNILPGKYTSNRIDYLGESVEKDMPKSKKVRGNKTKTHSI